MKKSFMTKYYETEEHKKLILNDSPDPDATLIIHVSRLKNEEIKAKSQTGFRKLKKGTAFILSILLVLGVLISVKIILIAICWSKNSCIEHNHEWTTTTAMTTQIITDQTIETSPITKIGEYEPKEKSPIQGIRIREIYTDEINSLINLRDGKLASGSYYNITIWDTYNGHALRTLNDPLNPNTLYIELIELSDGSLVSSSTDIKIKIWNPETGKLLKTFDSTFIQTQLVRLSDELLLSSGSTENKIMTWNITEGKLLKTTEISNFDFEIAQFVLLKDGNLAVSLYSLTDIIILNHKTGEEVRRIPSLNSDAKLALLIDGSLAIGKCDIAIWDVSRGELVKDIENSEVNSEVQVIEYMQLLSDGSLACAYSNQKIRIWSPKSGKLLKFFGFPSFESGNNYDNFGEFYGDGPIYMTTFNNVVLVSTQVLRAYGTTISKNLIVFWE